MKKLPIYALFLVLFTGFAAAHWIPATCGPLSEPHPVINSGASQQDCLTFCTEACTNAYNTPACSNPNFDWNPLGGYCECISCAHRCGSGDSDELIRCSDLESGPGPDWERYAYGDPGCENPQECWIRTSSQMPEFGSFFQFIIIIGLIVVVFIVLKRKK